ncbi:MAG: flagellar biosynthesis protein FlhA [bacterium]
MARAAILPAGLSPTGAVSPRLSNVVLAAGVLGILVIMLVPLPSFLFDLLITTNIAVSLVVLMVTLYVAAPLEFSVFPTLLLGLTLLRLSLNIASTRLILMRGEAGAVIDAFGNFVAGGNMVIGLVVFVILVIIQFIVITKGSGRVAEVAARFTLDAMPGRQMAIDADLNAGIIDEKEARRRREEISRAADFYGAMDGASKFVRGDAIASIIITVVNIVGGFIVGVLERGMSMEEAARTYTLLTIGDGLVTQIPALIVSTAAGIIVTRTAGQANLADSLAGQLLVEPRAPLVVAGVLSLIALVPGMPTIPFMALAAVTGVVGLTARAAAKVPAPAVEVIEEDSGKREQEQLKDVLQVDPLEVEIGFGLIHLVDAKAPGNLLDRITAIRRQTAREFGFIVPPVRIRDNSQLRSREYSVKIKGVRVDGGELAVDSLLAMNPGTAKGTLQGIETREPAFGLPAVWIREGQRQLAEALGYTVVEPVAVVATHLTEIIKSHAHEILTRQDVQALLDGVKEKNKAVVEELVPSLLSLGSVQRVLMNLLRERVSIRDLPTVLEALADGAMQTKDSAYLTELVRHRIGRSIVRAHLDGAGRLQALMLAPSVEEALLSTLVETESGKEAGLAPEKKQAIVASATRAIEKALSAGKQPVFLSSAIARPVTRRLFDPYFPAIPVISYREIPPGIEVISLGKVEANDAR